VRTIEYGFNQTLDDLEEVEIAVREFKPKMITVVHCETPSGTLNPIQALGALKVKYEIPLLYMDCVASMAGTPVESDAWHVDLALGGSQKALSAPPSMSMIAVSDAAWRVMEQVGYVGYDALLPLRRAADTPGQFPYTPNWHGVAALHAAAKMILNKEGFSACIQRHAEVAQAAREGLMALGLALFYAEGAIPSPTVTAVNVPQGWKWEDFDAALRAKGLVVGGSYGPMAGNVFRLGHMGSQARMDLVTQALDVIAAVI
jgi:aspartate aminotransferase-like enzyme